MLSRGTKSRWYEKCSVLAHAGDLGLFGPLMCIDWKFGSSSRVIRKGCMQLAAFHLQNTMHFPLRAFRRVASVLWTLVANQTSSQAKHHYTGGPRQACIGVVSTAISSPLTSVLVPLCTRLSLVVYRVHFMQAARRRPIQATKPDFNDFMTMNTHQEIVPCSQTQS